MSDNKDKVNNLLSFGLGEVESLVYLFLIESGTSSALTLSRALNIPRTSIYDALVKLGEKRLVSKSIRSKTTLYHASNLESFNSLIKKEEEKLLGMSSALLSLEAQLKPRMGELKSTDVRYYQGVEGLRQMIWNSLKAKHEIVGYSVFGRVEVVGIKFYQDYVKKFDEKGLKDRVIASPNKRTMDYIFKDVKPGFHQLSFQNIKTLPEDKLFIAGDTMIYNNIYAVSYWQAGEVVGFEIENEDFVKHELSVFELLWFLAKPIYNK